MGEEGSNLMFDHAKSTTSNDISVISPLEPIGNRV